MAQESSKRLDHGDPFPTLTLESADGASIRLPAAAEDGWLVLLVYRGHW